MNKKKIISIVAGLGLAVTVCAQTRAVSFRSQEGNYWQMRSENVMEQSVGKAQIVIRSDQPRQTFKGWGTCFNELDYDAWSLLSAEDRTLFNKRAFNPNGDLRLQVGRIPVGASDYASDWYSCDETKADGVNDDGTPNYATDFTMEHFTIERDRQKVIPSIKQALAENPDMTFWASPWSPPSWMKTNKHYAQRATDTNGCPFGVPPYNNDQFIDQADYYNAYCLYFDKFIQAYKGEGINITALAYQNEAYSNTDYPGCSWTAATTGKFLGQYLGPYMAEHQPDVKLIVGTMNTKYYDVYETILNSTGVSTYCQQVGFQWEGGRQIANVAAAFPDFELVQTESECGGGTFDWDAAAHTFYLCCHYLANGVTTYTYWNAILQDGGYSTWGWKQNALVQVNSEDNTARYCPEYYAYKHYTHFIPAGSKILVCDAANLLTSALSPDGNVIVVIGNEGNSDKTLTLDIDGHTLVCNVAPKSFATYVVGSEANVATMLMSEAQGLKDIESASLSSAQKSALNAAIDSGTYSDLLQAVGDIDKEPAHNTIFNPSFTTRSAYWTTNNVAVSGDFLAATVLEKTCFNNWSKNFTSLDIHQDLTVSEAGLYTVTAKSVCGEGNINDQHVYAETANHLVTSPVKADDVWDAAHWETQTTATIYVGESETLRVGYASTSGGGTKGWFCVTDFELTRVGDLTGDFDLEANRKNPATPVGGDMLQEALDSYNVVAAQAGEMAGDESYDAEARTTMTQLIASQSELLDDITEPALIGNLQRELEEAMQQVEDTKQQSQDEDDDDEDFDDDGYYSRASEGIFYLYNVTKQKFLTGTPAMTDTPAALTLTSVDENKYSISPAANQYLKMGSSGGQFLWNNGWANNGFFKWSFSATGTSTYKMSITATADADGYFTNGTTYYLNTVNSVTTTKDEADEWALMTEANYYKYLADQSTIPSTYYTTTPVAGNTYYLYSPYASCFLYATASHAGFQNTPAAITLTANGDDFNILFSSNSKYLKYDAVSAGNTWANGDYPVAWKFDSFHGATGLFFVKTLISETYQYLYAYATAAASWGGECWPTPETNNTRYAWALISEYDYAAWQNGDYTLDEATGYSAERDIKGVNVTVNKTMTANAWNTFVVPFDMTIPSGWTVKEPTAFDGSTLTFGDASSIVAGKPYIVKPTETVTSFSATGVTLKKDLNNTTVGNLTMTGTYEKIAAIDYSTQDCYVIGIKDGESALYKVNSEVSVKPFRAYFTVSGGSSARSIRLNFGDEATCIRDIEYEGLSINNPVYDLQGRPVFGKPRRGLYIQNGRKMIIK